MHAGLLGEMADSKIGEGTTQDEPGAHHSVKVGKYKAKQTATKHNEEVCQKDIGINFKSS